MNKITFFSRFEADILAELKTITIRDKTESHFLPQQRLQVYTNETDRFFCEIEVISVTSISFSALNHFHAQQENMALPELQAIIREIYPKDNDFFVIEFKLIKDE